MTTPPLAGLGADIPLIKRIVCGDTVTFDLLDQALQSEHGGDRSMVDSINHAAPQPDGTSSAAALRRLRKDRPDLHARVLAGEIKPHRAMVERADRL